MAQNLAQFQFNNRANKAISDDGWFVDDLEVVDALGGNDTIKGSGGRYDPFENFGIYNRGTINTGAVDDTITGGGYDFGISNGGTINTGTGNDTITGSIGGGSFGIFNYGTINTGTSNDSITGSAGRYGSGIENPGGTIDTGTGNDTITGSGGDYGISNGFKINTGTGNDTITGSAGRGGFFGILNGSGYYEEGILSKVTINTGAGNDTITGSVGGRGAGISNGVEYYAGINSNGFKINTGAGNDTITGSAGCGGLGIYNDGTIYSGTGKDIVDALDGGFGGDGITNLGPDNDNLKGFGSGNFYGGTGIDKILFGPGTYTVTGPTIVSSSVIMNVSEFEQIGGANGGLFKYANGTLTVNSDGVATFAI